MRARLFLFFTLSHCLSSIVHAQEFPFDHEYGDPSRISETAKELKAGHGKNLFGDKIDNAAVAAAVMAVPVLTAPGAVGIGTFLSGPLLFPGLFRSNTAWVAAGLSATALISVIGGATMTLALAAFLVGPNVRFLDALSGAALTTLMTFVGALGGAYLTANGLSFLSIIGVPLLLLTGVIFFRSLGAVLLFAVAVPTVVVAVGSVVGGVSGAFGAMELFLTPGVRGDVDIE